MATINCLDNGVIKFEKFQLYETEPFYYITSSDKAETQFRILKIDRRLEKPSTLKEILREDAVIYNKVEFKDQLEMIHDGNISCGGLVQIASGFGLLGFVKFLDCYYLTMITQRKLVGSIGNNNVYTIRATETFPIKPRDRDEGNTINRIWKTLNKKLNQTNTEIAESRYLGLYSFLDLTKDFYFSYSYDLTYSLQHNYLTSIKLKHLSQTRESTTNKQSSTTTTGQPSNTNHSNIDTSISDSSAHGNNNRSGSASNADEVPPRASSTSSYAPQAQTQWSAQEMFEWNYYQTEELKSIVTDPGWILPIIHGSFEQRRFSSFGLPLDMILIARRSRHYAGTRYLKRGVSIHGKVANDCEVEQILQVDGGMQTRFCSYLQMRGSIPTYWSQETSVTNPKPPIIRDRYDPSYLATQAHFADMIKRYNTPILVLDLVKQQERKRRESIIREMFREAIDEVNYTIPLPQQIWYYALDYTRISKSKKFASLKISAAQVGNRAQGGKYAASGLPPAPVLHEWEYIESSLAADSMSRYNTATSVAIDAGRGLSTRQLAAQTSLRGDLVFTDANSIMSTASKHQSQSLTGAALRSQSGIIPKSSNTLSALTTSPITGENDLTEFTSSGYPKDFPSVSLTVTEEAQEKVNELQRNFPIQQLAWLDVLHELGDISSIAIYETGMFCNTSSFLERADGVNQELVDKAKKVGFIVQKGVLRTNCVDCIDRTNVAQFALGMKFLAMSLRVLGLPDAHALDTTSPMARALIEMYSLLGDRIGLQYGGSEANKKLTAGQAGAGISKSQSDLLTSIKRYYSNAFTDQVKQDAMNIFLGSYIPSENAVALWDRDSTDADLHNKLLRPPTPYVNKLLFSDLNRVEGQYEADIGHDDSDFVKTILATVPEESQVVDENTVSKYIIKSNNSNSASKIARVTSARYQNKLGLDPKLETLVRRSEKRKYVSKLMNHQVADAMCVWWRDSKVEHDELLQTVTDLVTRYPKLISSTKAYFTKTATRNNTTGTSKHLVNTQPSKYFQRSYEPTEMTYFEEVLSTDFSKQSSTRSEGQDFGSKNDLSHSSMKGGSKQHGVKGNRSYVGTILEGDGTEETDATDIAFSESGPHQSSLGTSFSPQAVYAGLEAIVRPRPPSVRVNTDTSDTDSGDRSRASSITSVKSIQQNTQNLRLTVAAETWTDSNREHSPGSAPIVSEFPPSSEMLSSALQGNDMYQYINNATRKATATTVNDDISVISGGSTGDGRSLPSSPSKLTVGGGPTYQQRAASMRPHTTKPLSRDTTPNRIRSSGNISNMSNADSFSNSNKMYATGASNISPSNSTTNITSQADDKSFGFGKYVRDIGQRARTLVGGLLGRDRMSQNQTSQNKNLNPGNSINNRYRWIDHDLNIHKASSSETIQIYTQYTDIAKDNFILYDSQNSVAEGEFRHALHEFQINVDDVKGMERLASDHCVYTITPKGLYQGAAQSASATESSAFLFTSLLQIENDLVAPNYADVADSLAQESAVRLMSVGSEEAPPPIKPLSSAIDEDYISYVGHVSVNRKTMQSDLSMMGKSMLKGTDNSAGILRVQGDQEIDILEPPSDSPTALNRFSKRIAAETAHTDPLGITSSSSSSAGDANRLSIRPSFTSTPTPFQPTQRDERLPQRGESPLRGSILALSNAATGSRMSISRSTNTSSAIGILSGPGPLLTTSSTNSSSDRASVLERSTTVITTDSKDLTPGINQSPTPTSYNTTTPDTLDVKIAANNKQYRAPLRTDLLHVPDNIEEKLHNLARKKGVGSGLSAELQRLAFQYVVQQVLYAKEIDNDRLSSRLSYITSEQVAMKYVNIFESFDTNILLETLAIDYEVIQYMLHDNMSIQSYHTLNSYLSSESVQDQYLKFSSSKKKYLASITNQNSNTAVTNGNSMKMDHVDLSNELMNTTDNNEQQNSSEISLSSDVPLASSDHLYPGLTRIAPDVYIRTSNPYLQMNEIGAIGYSRMLMAALSL